MVAPMPGAPQIAAPNQAPQPEINPLIEALENGNQAQVDQILEEKRVNLIDAVVNARKNAIFGKRKAKKAANEYNEARDTVGGAVAAAFKDAGADDASIAEKGREDFYIDAEGIQSEVKNQWLASSLDNEADPNDSKRVKFLKWWTNTSKQPITSKEGIKSRVIKGLTLLPVGIVGGVVLGVAGGALAGAAGGAYLGKRFAKTAAKNMIENQAAGVNEEYARSMYNKAKDGLDAHADNVINGGHFLNSADITDKLLKDTNKARRKSRAKLLGSTALGLVPGLAFAEIMSLDGIIDRPTVRIPFFGSDGNPPASPNSGSASSNSSTPPTTAAPAAPNGTTPGSTAPNSAPAAPNGTTPGTTPETTPGTAPNGTTPGTAPNTTAPNTTTPPTSAPSVPETGPVVQGDEFGDGVNATPQSENLTPDQVLENLGAEPTQTPEEAFQALAANDEQWAAFERMVNSGNKISELGAQNNWSPAEIQERQMFSLNLAAIQEQMQADLMADGLDEDEADEIIGRRTGKFFSRA